jgi:hypothetical protein
MSFRHEQQRSLGTSTFQRGDTERLGLRTSVGVPTTIKVTCLEATAGTFYAVSALPQYKILGNIYDL